MGNLHVILSNGFYLGLIAIILNVILFKGINEPLRLHSDNYLHIYCFYICMFIKPYIPTVGPFIV
jgi:hypothetical protein